MNSTPPAFLSGAVVLALATTAHTQDKPAAQTAGAAAPPPKPAASAGLVNDWLRSESDFFKSWDFGGQVRARYELFENGSPAFPTRDFQDNGVVNDNCYLWLREKLHLGYKAGWIAAFAEARDSSSIGDNDPKNPGQDRFDIHQAFISLGNPSKFPLTAKVGRQELAYGDERILGPSDWSNTGRVFDAAKLRLEQPDFWLDAFAGRVVVPTDKTLNEPDSHDWLFGGFAGSKTLLSFQESQLYFLARNVSPGSTTTPRDIYTLGVRAKSLPGKLKGWDYTVEALGQLGNITQSGRRRDQEAFATSLAAGYTFAQVPTSPRLGLGYDFSSGDSDPTDATSHTLDNLFPTNHRHYGTMDFIGWRNIHDARASLTVKPHKKLQLSLDYHLFWLADTHDYFYPQSGSGRNGAGYGLHPDYSSFVGSELDLEAAYNFAAWGGLRAGYGHFFAGDYVRQSKAALGGATDADWFYAQLTFNF
jgi:hypothetical protein